MSQALRSKTVCHFSAVALKYRKARVKWELNVTYIPQLRKFDWRLGVKKLMYFLILICCSFINVSCTSNVEQVDVSISNVEQVDVSTWFDVFNDLEALPGEIELTLDIENSENLPSDSTLNVSWNNRTNQEMLIGKPFTIAYLNNDSWEEVKLIRNEVEFNSIGIILEANSSVVESYNLNIFDSEFKKGTYKFISSVIIDSNNYSIETEFEIY